MKRTFFSKTTFKRIVSFMLASIILIGAMYCTPVSAASKNVIRQNVSTKAVSSNATKGSLPTGTTTLTGSTSYYFNLQCSSDVTVKSATLYVKDVGSSSYKNKGTETAKNYMCYVYLKYTPANKKGTLSYYWKIKLTNGKTKTTSKTSVTVKKQTSTWQYPIESYKHSWGNGDSWAKSCTLYGRSNSGGRNYHVGIDLISTSGNYNVYAAASGTVAEVGTNSSNGKYVIIKHTISGKTVYTFYAHLASYSVKKGASVSAGDKIGKYGNTGSAASAGIKHLHFAVVDTLKSNGGYYGYATYFTGNKTKYSGITYYNPAYVIKYNKLP